MYQVESQSHLRLAEPSACELKHVVPQMWGISPDMARNPLIPENRKALVQALRDQYKDFGCNLFEHGVKVVFASDYVGKFEDTERAALLP